LAARFGELLKMRGGVRRENAEAQKDSEEIG